MKDFEIQFSGLKLGVHSFEFEVGKSFFDYFQEEGRDIQSIEGADIQVTVELEKKETMLVLVFKFSGGVKLLCDRCATSLQINLNGEERIIGKFSDEETWHEDEVIHIPNKAYKIDVAELLFEFILLAIPSKNVHPEGECDPEMLEKIEEYIVRDKEESEREIDPRWAKLKNLK